MKIDLNYKLQQLESKYVFIRIIFCYKVSVANFEHVFVCWEKNRITIAVLQILEIAYPANKYSKSTTGTLKEDVESAKS